MAKRKRGQPHGGAVESLDEFDPKASKLAVTSYRDIADSEDEFHSNRDTILLDEGPGAKRRHQREQDDIDFSDEEVLGYSEQDDDKDQDMDGDDDGSLQASEDASADEDEDEDEIGGWGTKKSDYYNADEAETEQDMLDEEAEARRIQQRQRKALSEADFGFDENTWVDADEGEDINAEDKGGVVTEVLPQPVVTDDMSPSERVKILKMRYPEFEPLSKEFVRLQPVYEIVAKEYALLQDAASTFKDDEVPVSVIKFRALSGYMGALAMYFALLTSPAEENPTASLPMAPVELREHDVIASLEQYQKLWTNVQELDILDEDSESDLEGILLNEEDIEEDEELEGSESEEELPIAAKQSDVKASSQARREARMRKTEEALAELSSLSAKQARTRVQPHHTATLVAEDDSDIGDEQPLMPHEAAEMAKKRKSLRFYTSQIAQKANKRANAGRAAGGDDDIPYRERLRDRQERLNREATSRSKKSDLNAGEELGAEDDDDVPITNRQREDMDEGEQALELRVLAKKQAKLDRDEAYRLAKEDGGKVVVRKESTVGSDGRREVGYVIEKNKGLTPKRKKIVKNPRVKKRKKFEEKSKKLRSMKATFRGGEGKGGYGGELTGIKKNLVRSTKL